MNNDSFFVFKCAIKFQVCLKEEEEEDGGEGSMLKRPASTCLSEDEPSSKKRSNEVDKLWRNVHDNPNDFQAWTLLLQHIDQVVSARGSTVFFKFS